MNPIILPPTMGKSNYSPSNYGQTRFFSLGQATSLGEGKLWIKKPVKLRLKIDLVSYPAWAEGWGK